MSVARTPYLVWSEGRFGVARVQVFFGSYVNVYLWVDSLYGFFVFSTACGQSSGVLESLWEVGVNFGGHW